MKPVEVQFDDEAYKEYLSLQDFVTKGRRAKKKPTYDQLLSSINTAPSNYYKA